MYLKLILRLGLQIVKNKTRRSQEKVTHFALFLQFVLKKITRIVI